MHTEVHVHGTVLLKNGVSQTDIELALRHWFDYVDVDGLADARSAHQDEPGIVFDRRRRTRCRDRKSTRLNSSHQIISYAVFCLKKKKPKAPIEDLKHTIRTNT